MDDPVIKEIERSITAPYVCIERMPLKKQFDLDHHRAFVVPLAEADKKTVIGEDGSQQREEHEPQKGMALEHAGFGAVSVSDWPAHSCGYIVSM